jgi:DNA repair protein RecO
MSIRLIKTEAICLNVRPFSKTSHMVTWLTRSDGCLTTPIKGAQRPKSAFLGKYDIGYTCELIFYARGRNGVHHIRECSPLHFREALRNKWYRAAAADYACDLTLRTTHGEHANDPLYVILSSTLETLQHCERHEAALTLLWYECQLLHLLGVAPDFTLCPQCPATDFITFSIEEGRPMCEHRPSRHAHPPIMSLHRDIRELFTTFINTPLPTILQIARDTHRTDDLGRPEPFAGMFGLRRFLGVFMIEHLDLLPGPRRTVLDILIGG